VNYGSPQVMQIQKEVEEIKKMKKEKHKKDEKKEYEYIYNKLTVTDYDVFFCFNNIKKEYKGYQANIFGQMKSVLIAIDGVTLYSFKKTPRNSELPKTVAEFRNKSKLVEVSLRNIIQLERGLYDDKKLYIWYIDKKDKKQRAVFQLEDIQSATELLAKIRFIAKSGNRFKRKESDPRKE